MATVLLAADELVSDHNTRPSQSSSMGVRLATMSELRLLCHAVAQDQYDDHVSDGKLRWAFLLDLASHAPGQAFPGIAGAIVLAEAGGEVSTAALYERADQLGDSWTLLVGPEIGDADGLRSKSPTSHGPVSIR
jgi:hypothetical protein